MGEHEGVNSVAASETEPSSGETLMGNLEQGGDESDIMVEVKGSDVFVDGDCLKKVDSESKTGDLDAGGDLGAKEVQEGKTETGVEDLQAARDVDEMECAEAVSERTDVAGPARDVVEMECVEVVSEQTDAAGAARDVVEMAVSEQTVVVEEVGDEDTEKGVEGGELASTGVESDVSVSNPGNETANEPESKSSENEPVTENAASIPTEDSSTKDEAIPREETSTKDYVIPGEETSTKDETRHDSVTDAGVSSSENDQGLVNSTVCEGVDKTRPAESENSQSQLAPEDDPLMPREEETTGFKDEAMRDPVADVGVSSSENDQGLVNRTVFNKANTDCTGHDSNKISDCPSEPRSEPSEIVREDATLMPGEEDTNFKDKDTHVEDAGLSSLENDQSLATPATCQVIDKDSSGHTTDKTSDSPVEAATEREIGEVNKDEILHSKVESMENIVDNKNSPHNEEGLQVDGDKHTAICDAVVAGSQSSDERADASDGCGAREVDSKGSDNPNCGVLDESESDKIIQTEAPKSADNDVKDNSEVLPDQQPSTESGTNNINGEDSELSHAKCNNLEKGDAMEVEVEGVLDSENRTSIHSSENDITLETSNNTVCPADAMDDVNEDKLDVTNATNLGPAKDSDVVQTDAMDIDEDKLGVVNASPKDSDIVQTDSELSVKNTVVVPANTEVIDSNMVAKSELEGLGGHESAPKDDENVGLVNKGNQAGNECTTDTEMIDDNSTFEFIDDGFWQEDEGRNTIPKGDQARSEGTPDMGSVQSHGQIGAEESLVECEGNVGQSDATPGTDTEICNQMSSQSACNSNEEVVMQQNIVLTPEVDHGQSTVMTTVAEEQVEGATGSGAYNEVIGQAIEMENADGFLDAHVPETTVLDEQQEEENEKLHSDVKHEIGEQREIQENASQTDQSLVSGVKATKPANFANIYPGFLLPPEKLGKYTVSDLVWGKVRSHPWWPGQIFDPADASEKAVRYYKKGCFLVAYFGDRTFAWNDATVLKPFWSHFSQIEKQSNSETFQNAVRGALDEVSRRIELGLACSCIPKSYYNKIACQVVENTGIREESSRRYGVDKSTGVKSFAPDKVLHFLRGVARSPTCGADQLDLVIARAQLLAYSRFKGCSELSEFLSGGELLENDEEGVTVNKGPSHKRKHNLKDSLQPTKKERRMSEIMGNSELDETLADGSDRTKSVYSAKVSSTTSVTPNPPPFKIGERILRAASHLKGDSTQPEASSPSQNPPKEKVAVPSELPSIDELFSQLQLVAQAPMGDYSFLNTFIHCILDLRYPKHSELQNSSAGRPVVGRKRRASQAPDGAAEDFEFDDINDSYWTDRIVQNYSEEQLLQNGENGGREEFPVSPFDSADKVHKATRRSYSRKRYSIGNNEIGVDECNEEAEKRKLEPAELILTFGEGNRLPTEMSLNKTFRRFGPLKELETEVHPDCARARVVFKRGSDAEVAYSSAGKFNIFGSMQVNYELNYTPVISVRPLLLTIPQGQEEAI